MAYSGPLLWAHLRHPTAGGPPEAQLVDKSIVADERIFELGPVCLVNLKVPERRMQDR